MPLTRITEVVGDLNVETDRRHANIRSALTRGLPQVRGHHAPNLAPICLIGGGPSLADAEDAIREQSAAGAKLVGLNGTYNWLIDHGLRPSAYVQVDARPTNLPFLATHGIVKDCTYFLASQLDPIFFDHVAGWPHVYVFHAVTGKDTVEFDILNEFYFGRWLPIDGGSTVLLRALRLFSFLGFKEFDLYGCDSCYLGDQHHAYVQTQNDADVPQPVEVAGREFRAAPWQISQAMEFIDAVKAHGDRYQLRIHGPGLLAHVLRAGAAAYDQLSAQHTPEES